MQGVEGLFWARGVGPETFHPEVTSMRGRNQTWRVLLKVGLLAVALGVASITASVAEETKSPEETLRMYLEALKSMDFGTAYDLSTKAMTQGKDRETWVVEMKYLFQLSEVKIFEFKVFPAKITKEKALVPNILTSQDKFLNQLAAPEYELYTLLREDGRWKVDRQTIVDPQDLSKWFPGEG